MLTAPPPADILGDFNRFRHPENYELAMQTLSEVVDQLLEAQEQLPWDGELPSPGASVSLLLTV